MSAHASDGKSKSCKTVELPKERQCETQGKCIKGVDGGYISIDSQGYFRCKNIET